MGDRMIVSLILGVIYGLNESVGGHFRRENPDSDFRKVLNARGEENREERIAFQLGELLGRRIK